jgi:hypothetical protein
MIIVKFHVAAGLYPALYRIPHHLGALVQHADDPATIGLNRPLFVRQLYGELGSVLEDEHEEDEH